MQRYVCAFVRVGQLVLLVRKNHPAWQAGRLNGVGGHVEEGESQGAAMQREFREETGVDVPAHLWQEFAQVRSVAPTPEESAWLVHFFRLTADDIELDSMVNDAGERLEFHTLDVSSDPDWLHSRLAIANLAWLIPMAHLDPTHMVAECVATETGA